MFEFEGYDMGELAKKWEIETDECKLIADYIWDHLDFTEKDDDVLQPAIKQDMLDFLDVLVIDTKKHCHGEQIWYALIDLADDDDLTFVQFFITLLPHMWT